MHRNKTIPKLHLITDGADADKHLTQVQTACKAGIPLVQLRIKNMLYADMVPLAQQAAELCRNHNCTLIIDDHIELALASHAHGVHLGKEDTPPREARKQLGPDMIMGGTANTLEDLQALNKEPVDYIGLGPYRYTSTKKKLSPVLGLEGYRGLMKQCTEASIYKPVIAIGGIQQEDVPGLLETGVHGVAVSSAINQAAHPEKAAQAFLNQLTTENTS